MNIPNFIPCGKMMTVIRPIAVFLLFSCCPIDLRAGGEKRLAGARTAALAGADVAFPGLDADAAVNPALLASVKRMTLFGTCEPGAFGLPELASAGMSFVVPWSPVAVSGSVGQFGTSRYGERTISVGLGTKLSDRMWLGFRFNLLDVSIGGFGHAVSKGMDAGVVVETGDVRWGCVLQNVLTTELGSSGERPLPAVIMGMAFRSSSGFGIAAAVEQGMQFPASFRCGMEKEWSECAALRVGFGNEPDMFTAGFCVRVDWITVSYGGASHPTLGWSHTWSLAFVPGDQR